MKTELWNGHQIRFVQVEEEWQSISKDIASALDYRDANNMLRHVSEKYKGTQKVSTLGGIQKMSTLTEFEIYKAIFNSHKKEVEQFQEWIFNIIKTLRTKSGLEGFEIFIQSLHPVRLNFMKANTVANKAVSNKFGFKKMVKKGEMTPQMLTEREHILEDIVNLMALQDKYGLNISISQTIYESANDKQPQPV